ncbi:MAG: S24 family peptidase [Clostridia bacterium]|nr:S24 family peptidase [Clostridia bacterium]
MRKFITFNVCGLRVMRNFTRLEMERGEEHLNTIGERLKYLREKHNLTQEDLAKATGLQRGNISHYEKNKIKPSSDAIIALASFFKISTDWLLYGKEHNVQQVNPKDEISLLIKTFTEEEKIELECFVDYLMFRRTKREADQESRPPSKKLKRRPPGMEPAAQVREKEVVYLPVLGESAAGQPIFINEILEGFIPVNKKLVRDKCFIVRAKGDSMTGRGIDDGDLVVIRRQPVVEAGEPALVRIGDESTIKYFYRQGDRVVLMSANPKYKPIKVRRPENVAVVGKVIHVIKKEEGETKLRDSQ